jgi:uncharacterized protein (DUF983 family)
VGSGRGYIWVTGGSSGLEMKNTCPQCTKGFIYVTHLVQEGSFYEQCTNCNFSQKFYFDRRVNNTPVAVERRRDGIRPDNV